MEIAKEMKIKDIHQVPEFKQAKGHLISGSEDFFKGENGELTLVQLQEKNPTWNHHDLLYGLERLREVALVHPQYVYPVYSVEDVEQDSHLQQVQLLYLPSEKKVEGQPIAILLAGGAYGAVCTMVETLPVAARFNELGVTCFCLNYRTAVQESFVSGLMPKPLDDLAAAWRYIHKHQDGFNVDAENYIVGGFSAGGHTTALWGTEHLGYRNYGIPSPQMLMLGYPLITTENLPTGPIADYINLGLFGDQHSSEDIHRYSANYHVDAEYPRVYLVQSKDDDTVPIKDAEDYVAALEKAYVPFHIEYAESGGHGFGLGSATPLSGWVERTMAFLNE